MRILFLSRWFPYPVDNGAKIRIYNLLKGLAARHSVDLISFYEDENIETGVEHLREFIGDVQVVPYRPFHPRSLKSMLGLFAVTPRSVLDTYQGELVNILCARFSIEKYDMVIASEIDMAIYALPLQGIKKVIEELEVTKILAPYQNETRLGKKLRNGLTWWKLTRYVRKILDSYDGCTVVSDEERLAVKGIYPGKNPKVIPNGVDCDYYQLKNPVEIEADSLIFNGSITYSVNYQAMAHFIQNILPFIQAHRPAVRLYITGKVRPELVKSLPHNDGVIFTGFVDDMRTVLRRCWVNIVPLTIGGGTRLKILEALAAGVPVVSTTIGAEGLDLVSGRDLILEDRPEDFADAVLKLLQDSKLRQRLVENGRKAVEAKYDWKMINQQMDRYLALVAGV